MKTSRQDSYLFQKILVGLILSSLLLAIVSAFLIDDLDSKKGQDKIIGSWVTIPEDGSDPIELAFSPDHWLTIMGGEPIATYELDAKKQIIEVQYFPGKGEDTVIHYEFEADDLLILSQEPGKVMRCQRLAEGQR